MSSLSSLYSTDSNGYEFFLLDAATGAMVPADERDFDEKAFFGALNLLPPDVILDKLTLRRDKSTYPFSRILRSQYTRRCRDTVIDLSNDSLLLDVELQGLNDTPKQYFFSDRVQWAASPLGGPEGTTFDEYKKELVCTKIAFPNYSKKTPGPFKVRLVDKLTRFTLTIKVRNLVGKLEHPEDIMTVTKELLQCRLNYLEI